MFAAHQLDLPIGFAAARDKLASLAEDGRLRGASQRSYDGEIDHLLRVGPVSKLVRISFLAPVYSDGAMSLGLRWEATGITGGLFPLLDANITATRAGERTTSLTLVGSYRPPLGALGASLDKAILNQVGAATMRTLLEDVATAMTTT
jgi:hypothetical protein